VADRMFFVLSPAPPSFRCWGGSTYSQLVVLLVSY